jgi:hypothetical protein
VLMADRTCKARNESGDPCRQAALREGEFCFWHSPDHSEEAAEARRLGGLRRRREKAVAGPYEFGGLGSVEQVRRLLEIAALDTLGLENSVARSRTLAYLGQVALKALEVGELEERVRAIESVLHPRLDERAAQEKDRRGWRWRR